MAVTANAEMTTVWEGTHEIGNWDWDMRLELTADHFSALQNGDKMVISMSQNVDDAGNEPWYQYDITANDYVKNRDPQRTPIASGDLSTNGDITINLTDEQVSLLKNYGMIINGHYVTVTKIAFGTEESGEITPPDTPEEGTTTELWSGTLSTGSDWSGYVDLSYDKRGDLANAKIGDIITVTFTTDNNAEYANIRIGDPASAEWGTAYDEKAEGNPTPMASPQTFTWEIPNAETLEKLQNNGVLIRGGNITITKVELTTYPENYEAVIVTIGTEGIATYSKSGKAIDFTNTNIKAYYASAVEKGKVTLTPINQVPAYTGIIVKGEPGKCEIPVIDKIDGLGTNYLKAVGDWDGTITASPDAIYHYSFTETATPTFSLVTQDTDIPAHKAYLETPTDITPETGSIELVFTDDTSTGINEIETEVQESGDNSYYNLQGMRVEHPTKGIYIHKGKKIIIR